MFRVLGLRKIANTEPQKYELTLRDLEDTKPNYVQDTQYGTESELRAMLSDGGMTEPNIEMIFEQAS